MAVNCALTRLLPGLTAKDKLCDSSNVADVTSVPILVLLAPGTGPWGDLSLLLPAALPPTFLYLVPKAPINDQLRGLSALVKYECLDVCGHVTSPLSSQPPTLVFCSDPGKHQ